MYATKRRRRNVKNYKHPPKENQKSNPSKRHRERLNAELENLASLLPFEQTILTKLDKLSILRLAVSYLRIKSYFQAQLLKNQHSLLDSSFERSSKISPIHYLDPNFSEGNSILESLNGFILIVNTNSEVFYASRTVENYIGFHQSDIIHQSVFELIHSEDREEFKKHLSWNSKLPADKANLSLNEILSSKELSKHLERNFTVRFRCLLDNTSGFLTLDIVGRLGVLHGQKSGFQLNANGEIVTTTQTAKTYNKGKSAKTNSAVAAAANTSHSGEANSTRNGHDQEPLLALFAIACPFGPPSLFELPQRESLFKTKHKINLAPISIDAKGKILMGYSDTEFNQFGGYDLIHPDDLKYYANAHKELLKTGSCGLICYRLITSNKTWQWLQTSMRVIYKSNKPECIIGNHRPLTSEEGEELYYKRGCEFKLPYPCLYDFESNFGNMIPSNQTVSNSNNHGDSSLGVSKCSSSSFRDQNVSEALNVNQMTKPQITTTKTATTTSSSTSSSSNGNKSVLTSSASQPNSSINSITGQKTKSSKQNKAQLIQQRAHQHAQNQINSQANQHHQPSYVQSYLHHHHNQHHSPTSSSLLSDVASAQNVYAKYNPSYLNSHQHFEYYGFKSELIDEPPAIYESAKNSLFNGLQGASEYSSSSVSSIASSSSSSSSSSASDSISISISNPTYHYNNYFNGLSQNHQYPGPASGSSTHQLHQYPPSSPYFYSTTNAGGSPYYHYSTAVHSQQYQAAAYAAVASASSQQSSNESPQQLLLSTHSNGSNCSSDGSSASTNYVWSEQQHSQQHQQQQSHLISNSGHFANHHQGIDSKFDYGQEYSSMAGATNASDAVAAAAAFAAKYSCAAAAYQFPNVDDYQSAHSQIQL